jgi:hypothetical protein
MSATVLESTPATVVVTTSDVPTVVISAVGPQGPPGTGAASYVGSITTTSSATSYTVTHNLGLAHPRVTVYMDGVEVIVGPPTVLTTNSLSFPLVGAEPGTVFDVVVTS